MRRRRWGRPQGRGAFAACQSEERSPQRVVNRATVARASDARRPGRVDRGARHRRVVAAVCRAGRDGTRGRACRQRDRHDAAVRPLPATRLHGRAPLADSVRARSAGARRARAPPVPGSGGATGLDRDELVQHAERRPARAQRRSRECDALAWLELRAMLGGLRPLDSSWARARLEAEQARASELERAGHWVEALRLDDAVARDYAHWPAAAAAARRAAVLRGSREVARYDAEARRLAERDLQQGLGLPRIFSWARSQRDPPTLETLAAKLRIAELQRTVERGDSLAAASARRLLARVWVNLAFYEPRAYLATGSPERAMRMLETAATIGPIEGEACALLREALSAASATQRERLAGQCQS